MGRPRTRRYLEPEDRALTFHESILGPAQRRALEAVAPFMTSRGFYLAGGTALALRLGHRKSVDLDWFTSVALSDPLQLAAEITGSGIDFDTGHIARGTLYGTVRKVRLSCIEFRYPLLEPVDHWSGYNCDLASLRDIGAMKISAVAQRGAKKDFIDLYALGVAGFSLEDLLSAYRSRFAVDDTAHILYALGYFDQADSEKTPSMLTRASWREVKRALSDQVRRLGQ